MTVWGLFDDSYSPGPSPLLSLHRTEEGARDEARKPDYAGMDLTVEPLEVDDP